MLLTTHAWNVGPTTRGLRSRGSTAREKKEVRARMDF